MTVLHNTPVQVKYRDVNGNFKVLEAKDFGAAKQGTTIDEGTGLPFDVEKAATANYADGAEYALRAGEDSQGNFITSTYARIDSIGNSSIVVPNTGNPMLDGNNLQEAYNLAKSRNPSKYSSITIVAEPGDYSIDLLMDTDWINLVCSSDTEEILPTSLNATASNITLKNINVPQFIIGKEVEGTLVAQNVTCIGCTGGNYSFGSSYYADSLIENCIFQLCVGGDYSFGSTYYGASTTIKNSKFIDCLSGSNSFGFSLSSTLIEKSTFETCFAPSYSFGSGNGGVYITSSNFKDCEAGYFCLGYGGNNLDIYDCTFYRCSSGGQSLGAANNSLIINLTNFIECVSMSYGFGYSSNGACDIIKSYFNDCTSGGNSFGVASYARCTIQLSRFKNCVSPGASFGCNNYGTTDIESSIFEDCVSANYSFGSGVGGSNSGTITVKNTTFKFCHATDNSFVSPDNSATDGVSFIIGCFASGVNTLADSYKVIMIDCFRVSGIYYTRVNKLNE